MDMISKKDLLESTGISYGQLYRWKRERLLPEEWFVKKSSFTGQETFFPRERVLARVRAILELKDSHSLEELADLLGDDGSVSVSVESLSALDAAGLPESVREYFGSPGVPIAEVALALELSRVCARAGMAEAETLALITGARAALDPSKVHETLCTVFAAGGETHACLSRGSEYPGFDAGIRVIASFSLAEPVGALRVKMEASKKSAQ